MHRSRIAAVVGGLMAVLCATVTESPASEARIVTWEDVLRAARGHPTLLAASSEVDEASGAVRASRQYPNPVLGFAVGRAEAMEGNEEEGIWDLDLTVPLLSLGVYRGETKAATAERDAAGHDFERVRLEVLGGLREMFLRVAHDQDRLSALEASCAQLGALVEVAGKRVDMGEARPMELSRIEIEAARMELELSEARETARARRRVFSLWLGSGLPEDFVVEAEMSDLPTLPSVDEAVAAAIRMNPEVASSDDRLKAASARLGAERGARFPTVELGGFYEKEIDSRNYGASLELSVPIWNWNSGRIARARAAEATARHRQSAARARVEGAVRGSHAAAVSAYARAQGFRETILPKATEVAGSMEKMYQVGAVDVMNVLDARRELIETESDLLEAYLNSQLAYLRLATLMGDYGDE